jgi:hypothetical protein
MSATVDHTDRLRLQKLKDFILEQKSCVVASKCITNRSGIGHKKSLTSVVISGEGSRDAVAVNREY